MNKVTLTGVISSEFVLDHEIFDEKFYKTFLTVTRKSGAQDELPLIISERLLADEEYVGCEVSVSGQFRSRNVADGKKGHLVLFVFVSEINITSGEIKEEDVNHIVLEGFLCKQPTYRKTPSEREISDLLVAVNRRNGKSDYIPCIAWGRNAVFASTMPVGAMISLEGRVQSRIYTKILGNQREGRVAYEVSVSRLKVQE